MIDMKLPELGENVEGGDVLRVLVKAGDRISKDQPVLELETDKATIEVPSSAEGVVKDIKVKAGEKVKVGQTIFIVEDGGAPAANDAASPPKSERAAASGANGVRAEPAEQRRGDAEGGDGPRREVKAERDELSRREVEAGPPKEPVPEPARAGMAQGPVPVPPKGGEPKRPAHVVEMTRPKPVQAAADPSTIPAGPSARRLARELGVNLPDIPGSGPGGRISMDDVTAYARRLLAGGSGGGARVVAATPLPDFSAWGAIERKPMTSVRRTTAHRLTQAWNMVPHVVQHDRADITSVDALRKRLSKKAEADGRAPVTITAFLIKTLAAALKTFPQVNSSVDLQSEEIIYKQYINVGMAVDTDRGLLVPVIRGVDQKDLFQLADEIAQAAEKARGRKLSLNDIQGGTFTISNLGGLGGGAFSPIVNWPEVAILGVARAKMEPVWADGQFVPRLMIPLSLSYDHRVVDGADGVRFLRWVVEALEQPALIWLDA